MDPHPTRGARTDLVEIAEAVGIFFDAFTVAPDLAERMVRLRALFVPGAVITRLCGMPPVVMSVEEFVSPRQELLASGAFSSFREWPGAGRIDHFGDLAHWFGAYRKAWTDSAGEHLGAGKKSIQFARTPAGWRISAAAWDDEPQSDGTALR